MPRGIYPRKKQTEKSEVQGTESAYVSPITKQFKLARASRRALECLLNSLRQEFESDLEIAPSDMMEPEEAAALERALLSAAEDWNQRNTVTSAVPWRG
jgi:hypothetical protein